MRCKDSNFAQFVQIVALATHPIGAKKLNIYDFLTHCPLSVSVQRLFDWSSPINDSSVAASAFFQCQPSEKTQQAHLWCHQRTIL